MLFFLPIITMPKRSIDKNNKFVFDKDDIRLPQKPLGTPSVPKSGMPDRLFEYDFRLRIGRPNPAHDARSIRRGIKAIFFAKPGDLYRIFAIFLPCFSHCCLLNKNFKGPGSNQSGLQYPTWVSLSLIVVLVPYSRQGWGYFDIIWLSGGVLLSLILLFPQHHEVIIQRVQMRDQLFYKLRILQVKFQKIDNSFLCSSSGEK